MAENQEQPQPLTQRGYDFDLVKKEQGTDFECTICQLLLRDAHSTPCHHAFCQNCLTNWAKELERGNRPITCPNCNNVYEPEKAQYNGFVDRMVKTSLDVKCKRNDLGCSWQGKIIDYQDHKRVCGFELVLCENQGCKEKWLRLFTDHQLYCQYRIIECLYCRLQKPVIEMKNHHSKCPMMKVICPNEKCQTQVLRKDIGQHLSTDCLYEKIVCRYSEIGCQKKVERFLMDTHCKDFVIEHQMMMFQDNKQVKQQLQRVENDLKEEKRKNELVESELKEEKRKNERLEIELKEVKMKIKTLEEQQEKCNKLHRNNFSIIDTLSYDSFHKEENEINVFGKIQLSHLIKKQYKLLERNVPTKPFQFLSHFRDTFEQGETNGSLKLKGDVKSYKDMIRNAAQRMNLNQMYHNGPISLVKVELLGLHKIKYVDLKEFTELKKQKTEFENNNIIIVPGFLNRKIYFLRHKEISPQKVKMCVITDNFNSNKFELIDDGEDYDKDFDDGCIKYYGNETLFFYPSQLMLIALYE